jgi:hypothetical protein
VIEAMRAFLVRKDYQAIEVSMVKRDKSVT